MPDTVEMAYLVLLVISKKMPSKQTWSFLLTLVCGATLGSHACGIEERISIGKYLQDSNFTQIKSSSMFSCAAECYSHSICRSFNFNKVTRLCSLHLEDNETTPELITDDLFNVYSNIKMWPRLIKGPCKEQECGPHEKCTVTRLGTPTCDIEIYANQYNMSGNPIPLVASFDKHVLLQTGFNPDRQDIRNSLGICTNSYRIWLVNSGWYGHTYTSKFIVSTRKLTWAESVAECSKTNGNLAIVNTASKYEQAMRAINDTGITGFVWLGASDIKTEGKWTWVDGKPMEIDRWARHRNQPNNINEQDCLADTVMFENSNRWFDNSCSDKNYCMCEKYVLLK